MFRNEGTVVRSREAGKREVTKEGDEPTKIIEASDKVPMFY